MTNTTQKRNTAGNKDWEVKGGIGCTFNRMDGQGAFQKQGFVHQEGNGESLIGEKALTRI